MNFIDQLLDPECDGIRRSGTGGWTLETRREVVVCRRGVAVKYPSLSMTTLQRHLKSIRDGATFDAAWAVGHSLAEARVIRLAMSDED